MSHLHGGPVAELSLESRGSLDLVAPSFSLYISALLKHSLCLKKKKKNTSFTFSFLFLLDFLMYHPFSGFVQ